MSIQTYLAAVPKAELHVHLEGSILPGTLLTLAKRNGIELPATTVDGLRELFAFRDFDHFIEIYGMISRCLKTTDDFETIAYEFGAEMARQHCLYAEVTFTPSFHHHHGHPDNLFLDGLERGRKSAREEFGVEIRWVFDIIRNITGPELNAEYADYTTSLAIECMNMGVISLGLGGGENGFPPEPFAQYFTRAKAAGLHSDPHAGEVAGPESVWGAIRSLGAERIGHGVRSIEDPELVAYLAQHEIPIEVNPTSNIRLGVYPSLSVHPLRRLYEAGVPLSVNSDDPPLFSTTLNEEVLTLAGEFAFDVATIDDILLNGVRHSFLPPDEKAALEKRFTEELAARKREHLADSDS